MSTRSVRSSLAPIALLSLLPIGAASVLYPFQAAVFRRYFGEVDALLAVALIVATGAVALWFLNARGWFEIFAERRTLRGIGVSATLATAFAAAAIAVDLAIPFPRELNVPAPWSAAFYPAMGYVAEILFHILPLALLIGLLGPLAGEANRNRLLWRSIFLVSLLEPVFQVASVPPDQGNFWRETYVALHVFVFNVCQLSLFRRFDFVSMLSFRLIYYTWWHLLWGHMRLSLLFA